MEIGAITSALTSEISTVESLNGGLGQDAFLELLVTQLQYQDPLEPMENTEFIAQLAQFTSLEQMTELNDKMASLQSIQAMGLIGTQIEATDINGQYISGVVTSVDMSGSEPLLVVDDSRIQLDGVIVVTYLGEA